MLVFSDVSSVSPLEGSKGLKRVRTPSPVSSMFDDQLKKLQLLKSRMKYASSSPEDFISAEVFRLFPEVSGEYRLVTDLQLLDGNITLESIDSAINSIKDLLVNAIILSYEGNWVLVSQVEGYYHDTQVDDVAQNDSHYAYSNRLQVDFEKCEMGRGLWYGLCFRYKKLEFIATGGIFGNNNRSKPVDAFLSFAVPPCVSQDTGLL